MGIFDVPFGEREYGFAWGPCVVTRLHSVREGQSKGAVYLEIATTYSSTVVRVSPTGKAVTVMFTRRKPGGVVSGEQYDDTNKRPGRRSWRPIPPRG